jgi:MarR family transcriptional repressor of emrRAB
MDPLATHTLVERLSSLLRAEERMAASRHDLPPAQLSALAYFARCNRYSNTPSALTEFLGTTRGTTSQTLMRLVEKGMLRSEPDLDDGRVVRFELTTQGRRVVKDVDPPALLAQAVSELPEPAVQRLDEGLVLLLRELQAAHGQRTFGVCRSCHHFQGPPGGPGNRCGLTGEALRVNDISRICREHEPHA